MERVSHCGECGYDWAGRPEDAVAVVRGLPAELAGLVDESDERLRARRAPEVWSPLEYVAHTGDAIGWYTRRIQRVLTEERAVLDPFDWDAYTAEQRYQERRLEQVLDSVGKSCATFVGLLADPAAGWEREGIGSDGQPRTVTQLAHRAAHEACHHLRDIKLGLT